MAYEIRQYTKTIIIWLIHAFMFKYQPDPVINN